MEQTTQPQQIADDVVVKLAYALTVEGDMIDSAERDDPITFIQGRGEIIPGLEKALYGLKAGDSKHVTVDAAEAYGEFDAQAILDVARSEFPQDVPLEIGLPLQVRNEDDEIIDTRIHAFNDNSVQLDFNHPLAGKELNFDVTVVGLRLASPEELAHGHTHSDDHQHPH